MKSERFLELMSKTDDDLIERAENGGIKVGKSNHRWISWLAAAAGLVLMVGVGFNVPAIRDLFDGNNPSVIDPDNPEGDGELWLPAKLDEIIWKKDDQGDDIDAPDAFIQWNGWEMEYNLYDALQRAGENEYIAVLVTKQDAVDLDSFEYKGTTYREIRSRDDELRALGRKLLDFPKEGEWLKYGELLYTTGTPDGEKWAKELYEERVAYYGEEFIAEYIVDGEVQTEKIDETLQEIEAELDGLSKTLSELLGAYHQSYGESLKELFSKAGVCAVMQDGRLFLFVTADELAELKISDKGDYRLSLAERRIYEGGESGNSGDVEPEAYHTEDEIQVPQDDAEQPHDEVDEQPKDDVE